MGQIVGFRCGLPEFFRIFGYYDLKMGRLGCTETSVLNQPTLRNNP
jgi:hypothetical protein